MIVIGIDPGFARLGYGVINYTKNTYKVIEYGTISTKAGEPLHERLKKIREDLNEVINRYSIEVASIEDLFFNTNTKTAIHVAEARGVILCTLSERGINIKEFTPLQVKQALVGYGRADKVQMKNMVKSFLKLKDMPKLDDTTDALALAICYTQNYKYEQCMAKNINTPDEKKCKTRKSIEEQIKELKKSKKK